MPTRNVVLTDHQSELLDRLVASGRYQNASEAMRAGLRMLEEDEARMARLADRIDDVIADYEKHGALDEPAEVTIRRAFAEARAKYEDKTGGNGT
ncbi:type II toxin-antitoxin system ParD family antitoxin [Pelagovum pacificum]|uniref:Type II toxin-antitoxin system ParD family antitoxin n=1 Tax=Pelagovum pacificum TaxID=2588711 RepID=A0A5C5GG02_9RHOB|nr:type II toxin-antitoxin system ParD family antitoxin [Pelagovum pacificum]QQA44409.1 type II toxin-antitoxin system ParD family antitoxin [Pelagovum pacificum]TNY32476.1 type II toxin-antitoxin system ParD family antitoxin [Pelagovum pacificum]